MIKVTKEQFFRALYADPRDIMPSIVSGRYPYATEWRTNDNRRDLFGTKSRDSVWSLTETHS